MSLYVVVQNDGMALQPDGTWGELARTFDTVEGARAARPGHADGTARSRVIFASQRKRFKQAGCLCPIHKG
jgi:hypothetical protein